MQSSQFGGTALNPTGTKIQVDVWNLEDYVTTHQISHIDLLKLDIEGAEYEVLLHLSDDIRGNIQALLVEYHQITPELKTLHTRLEEKLKHIFPHFTFLPHPYSKDLGYWRGRK